MPPLALVALRPVGSGLFRYVGAFSRSRFHFLHPSPFVRVLFFFQIYKVRKVEYHAGVCWSGFRTLMLQCACCPVILCRCGRVFLHSLRELTSRYVTAGSFTQIDGSIVIDSGTSKKPCGWIDPTPLCPALLNSIFATD